MLQVCKGAPSAKKPCLHCDKEFDYVSHSKRHHLHCKQRPATGSKRVFTCRSCGQTYRSFKRLEGASTQ